LGEHAYETDDPPGSFWSGMHLRSTLARAVFIVAMTGTVSAVLIGIRANLTATHGPLVPDVQHGLTVPYNNHGTTRYISETHSIVIDASAAVFFPCFITVFAFSRRARRLDKRPG
jgi:hypothetical protein